MKSSTALSLIPTLSRHIRAPMLTADEEERLFARYFDGDKKAGDRIVNAHVRMVAAIAMKYRNYGYDLNDLFQEAMIGMIRALERFRPEHGVRFSTYARWWVKAALNEAVQRQTLIRITTTAETKTAFFKLRRLKAAAGILHDNDLSPEETVRLANEMKIDPQTVFEMNRRLMPTHITSLDAPAYDEGRSLVENMACEHSDPEARDEDIDRKTRLDMVRDALAALKPRERDILVRRNLVDTPETLEDLSAEYGVTRERVRQIEVKAKNKIIAHIGRERIAAARH